MPQITADNSIAYIVPLLSKNQAFPVSLAGNSYNLRVWWSEASACWILDIADSQQEPLVNGIPLVTGCDILEQYGYHDFNGAMVVQSSNDPDLVPDDTTLGTTGNLFFLIPTAGNV